MARAPSSSTNGFQHIVPGADADQFLQEIYAEKCQLVVLCVSGDYGRKAWTLAEHEVIRALQMQLLEGPDAPTARFRVYPIRVGEGDVRGIPKNTIIAEVRRTPIKETAELIVARLDATETPTDDAPGRFIFLAECTPDREDPTEPVNRQRIKTLIESLGWSVLPAREYPAGAILGAVARGSRTIVGVRPAPRTLRVEARGPRSRAGRCGGAPAVAAVRVPQRGDRPREGRARPPRRPDPGAR